MNHAVGFNVIDIRTLIDKQSALNHFSVKKLWKRPKGSNSDTLERRETRTFPSIAAGLLAQPTDNVADPHSRREAFLHRRCRRRRLHVQDSGAKQAETST